MMLGFRIDFWYKGYNIVNFKMKSHGLEESFLQETFALPVSKVLATVLNFRPVLLTLVKLITEKKQVITKDYMQ